MLQPSAHGVTDFWEAVTFTKNMVAGHKSSIFVDSHGICRCTPRNGPVVSRAGISDRRNDGRPVLSVQSSYKQMRYSGRRAWLSADKAHALWPPGLTARRQALLTHGIGRIDKDI